MQSSKYVELNTVNKRHTDFSIDNILNNNHSEWKKIFQESNSLNSHILDLSTGITIQTSQKILHDVPKSIEFPFIPESILSNASKTLNKTQSVLKPKVYKYSEHHMDIRNCSDCELYFKNLNVSVTNNFHENSVFHFTNPAKPTQIMEKYVNDLKLYDITIINSKDNEITYKCKTCEKVFDCANALKNHEETHKFSRYECADCGKGFSQLRNYKYHISVHRGTKEFAAECPECGKTFNDKGYLSSHMKIHKNKKEYECPYCSKSFNQRVAFNMHVRIHTGVKPHKCSECGKRFSRKMLLKQHMRTHSGEKPYQCSVCGKSFADRSNMTLHHRLHSGIKPFKCSICPKSFTKKHHLKTHLNYHTGCKPYKCPHLHCNQAFTQSSNMRTHAKKCQFRPIDMLQ